MHLRAIVIAGALALGACGLLEAGEGEAPAAQRAALDEREAADPPAPPAPTPIPEGVFAPLFPPQINAPVVALGRRLFHDPRLSGDGTVSCSSCHALDRGGADGRPLPVGAGGRVGLFNAPTVFNVARDPELGRLGGATTVEDMVQLHLTRPSELGSSWEQVTAALSADPALLAEVRSVFEPDSLPDQRTVTGALGEYVRSLVTLGRFDRFLLGEESALTPPERAGMLAFHEAGCTSCHRGAALGGESFERLGRARSFFDERGVPPTEADLGRFVVTQDERDLHVFKVPTLRNVALTAPYLHDGSVANLEDAVRLMGRYQLGVELEDAQVASIVTFLGALTGELPSGSQLPAGTPPGTTIIELPTPGRLAPSGAPVLDRPLPSPVRGG